MIEDIFGFRNSGVVCLMKGCERCERSTEHAINLVLDRERKRQWIFGCRDCGKGEAIGEGLYDELYELSFEYDAWRAGELEFAEFLELVPEALRGTVLDRARDLVETQWKCVGCGEFSPRTIGECWNCGYENPEIASISYDASEPVLEAESELSEGDINQFPKLVVPEQVAVKRVVAERPLPERVARAKPDFIRMSNGIAAPLGIGLVAGVLSCALVVGLRYGVEMPSIVELFTSDEDALRWAHRFEPLLSGALSLVLGIVLGAWLSLPRFPNHVTISARGVEISGRGGKPGKLYGYGYVRRARYSEEGRYLTLNFADGNAVVVEMGRTTCADLRRFFIGRI